MKTPLRIAILECDTLKYGGYGRVFKVFLEAGADALRMPDVVSSKGGLEISKWDVVNEQKYPALEDIDAILISGSRHNSFEDIPWILKLVDFTKKILEQDRIRIIGVCFGHQIVGRAMGVKVARSDTGWEISVTPMELTAKGKDLFKQDSLSLHQMHRDIVYEYPKGVEELGASPRCSVQGMYAKGRVITVQGHPEFNQQIMTGLLEERHAKGIFNDELYEDGMARAGKHHDGVAVSSAFLRFLLED